MNIIFCDLQIPLCWFTKKYNNYLVVILMNNFDEKESNFCISESEKKSVKTNFYEQSELFIWIILKTWL